MIYKDKNILRGERIMEYYYCANCKCWQPGVMTTGGFYCYLCGKHTIYVSTTIYTNFRKESGYYSI
jgi:hypothetical protein